MSLPCPERDALESTEQHATSWPISSTEKLTPKKKFRLTTGGQIHFLGVSNGTGMREKPNLHIAVFGLKPPEGSPLNTHLLSKCQFGGLITGPDSDEWFWAEGLEIASVGRILVKFKTTGHRAHFRPV